MPRPANPSEALFWDRERLKHESPEETDQALIVYAIRRKMALDKDYKRSQAALPPERRYVSELDKREARKQKSKEPAKSGESAPWAQDPLDYFERGNK